jgi:hypothetical protein
MTIDAAISAGAEAFWLKLPLVLWLVLFLLLMVDRRKHTSGAASLLAAFVALCRPIMPNPSSVR